MTRLAVESIRGSLVETVHRVSVAVVDVAGRLVAHAGDPDLMTPMRSVAKPFQAAPLVADGVVERFGITTQELALACASHSAEPPHLEVVRSLLDRIGCGERDLVCGPHGSLAADLAVGDHQAMALATDLQASALASDCSGKHAGMLALARHRGWDIAGYHRSDHPVQQRCREEVARWAGLPPQRVEEAVDGCGVVCFGMPLRNIALGYVRIATSSATPAPDVVGAMWAHPDLVAGRGRLCTAVMMAYPGEILAKVGAAGLYGLAVRSKALGVALKVEDGNARAALVAAVRVLSDLGIEPPPRDRLSPFAELPVLNSKGEVVGSMRATGELAFE